MRRSSGLIVILIFFASWCSGQTPESPPVHWIRASGLVPGTSFIGRDVSANSNGSGTIERELLDTNLLCLLAQPNKLTKEELATVTIAATYIGQDERTKSLSLYQIAKPDKAFDILEKPVEKYFAARKDGHSKEFCLNVFGRKKAAASRTDPGTTVVYESEPLLAGIKLCKVDSGAKTNKAGRIISTTTTSSFTNGKVEVHSVTNMPTVDEVFRWVSYVVVDGDLAWRYKVTYRDNGKLDNLFSERLDSKDYDPKYQDVIKGVEKEIRAEMKRNGTDTEYNALRRFWQMKKRKLKDKNIDWRIPAELNSVGHYD